MPTISAMILARNEERSLRNCLETVRWCDEIVVVDMDSEDGTASVARNTRTRSTPRKDPVVRHCEEIRVERTETGCARRRRRDDTGSWPTSSYSFPGPPSTSSRFPSNFIMGEWSIRWGYTLPRFFRREDPLHRDHPRIHARDPSANSNARIARRVLRLSLRLRGQRHFAGS
jgi:glycosyltransferase involved in cell wall biosynthesis